MKLFVADDVITWRHWQRVMSSPRQPILPRTTRMAGARRVTSDVLVTLYTNTKCKNNQFNKHKITITWNFEIFAITWSEKTSRDCIEPDLISVNCIITGQELFSDAKTFEHKAAVNKVMCIKNRTRLKKL